MSFSVISKRQTSRSEALSFIKQTYDGGIVGASGTGSVLHLDARKNVVTDANKRVSSWGDLSLSLDNFSQLTATNQPLLTTDSTGNPCILFDMSNGRADYLNGSGIDHRNKTVVFVYEQQTNANLAPADTRSLTLLSYGIDSTTARNGIYDYRYYNDMQNGADLVQFNGTNNLPYSYLNGAISPASYNGIVRDRMDISDASSHFSVYRNGIDHTGGQGVLANGQTNTSTGTKPVGILTVGSTISNVIFNSYKLYEVAVFDKLLSTTEMNNVNIYINNTYGAL